MIKKNASVPLFLVLMVMLADCANRDPHFKIIPTGQGFLLGGFAQSKLDILWVIDNSGSMGPKQTNLANTISNFTQAFLSRNLDFQFAVTTTDIRPVDPAHPNDPNFSGQDACFVGNPTIILPTTPNVASTLGTNASVGFFGTADAHGLDAIRMALTTPNINSCNLNFLRSDAFLAVIVFSDADDNTSSSVNDLIAQLDLIRPPATSATGRKIRQYSISAMVVEDLAKPECQALGPFSEVGTKYISLAQQTNGAIASICDADFSNGLLQVGTKILESATAIQLSRIPDIQTIAITSNGTKLNNSSQDGWTFDLAANSIIFHGSAIPTGNQTFISVDYTPNDIVR